MRRIEVLDPATIVLLMGLAVGLGIVVHEGFFLGALAIGVIALARTVLYAIKEHGSRVKMAHRHS